jgi:hypothetical protein
MISGHVLASSASADHVRGAYRPALRRGAAARCLVAETPGSADLPGAFPGMTRSREHLLGLLWPDKDEAKARHSLNEALRRLRVSLGLTESSRRLTR